jgi:hypothetical protein
MARRGQAYKYGAFDWLMRSEPSPLDKWISNNNTYINGKLKKSCTDFLPFKKATFTKIKQYITKPKRMLVHL